MEGVKAACGADFPVTIRLSLRQFMKDFDKCSFSGDEEVGRTLEESVEIARLLESYGYDALSVDSGNLDAYYYACPTAGKAGAGIYQVGDGREVGSIMTAIWEAYEVAHSI